MSRPASPRVACSRPWGVSCHTTPLGNSDLPWNPLLAKGLHVLYCKGSTRVVHIFVLVGRTLYAKPQNPVLAQNWLQGGRRRFGLLSCLSVPSRGGLLLPVTESFRLQRFVAHPSKAWCTHGRSSFFTGPDMEHNYVKTR